MKNSRAIAITLILLFFQWYYPLAALAQSALKSLDLTPAESKTNANLADNPLWYKDAVIYELHIKCFYDSNGDGYGDFHGLLEKLDYLQDLGVTCIWLLPFFPSPLRDDGYDISDFKAVNPLYGNIRDFQQFVSEAHRRGIRVMIDFVTNHTSDQHPWFQAARKAAAGSSERNYYVWSDTDQKYKGTRIIFIDWEKSNWTWDPVAKAYYWHRFFYHQPDLNYDNPEVLRAVLGSMRFWLDMGVDALRLDATPYLIEREGTNCESLPETHQVLKAMRRELDAHYPNRALLSEANQPVKETLEYFGDGDECQMQYNFPPMPRIFLAVYKEDRRPIVEQLEATARIPDNCQWAVFLRTHDELSLEMVTDEERAYMYKAYAPDPAMRSNVGIRRRLASLMDFNRARIEMLNALLLSLPGTPMIYYGDEIGMGDNIHLNDRDGLRTPMQWSDDLNGGFSSADLTRLYNKPLTDQNGGYQTVNVKAQLQDPSSLLNWMKKAIKIRQQHKVFGRGTMQLLYPDNQTILAYIRQYEGETVLAVLNLSSKTQSTELDLSSYRGATPVEMFGNGSFPPVNGKPYKLNLKPHEFHWLLLSSMGSGKQSGLIPSSRNSLLNRSRRLASTSLP